MEGEEGVEDSEDNGPPPGNASVLLAMRLAKLLEKSYSQGVR